MSCWSAAAAPRLLLGMSRRVMRRVISVYLPTWPSDRLRRHQAESQQPDQPLVLSTRQGSRRTVFAADAEAQAMGLWPGMPIAQAQAMVPRLAVVDADPQADAAELAKLARWAARRFSPWAAPCPPDGL